MVVIGTGMRIAICSASPRPEPIFGNQKFPETGSGINATISPYKVPNGK
jgi:hypothetical protein